MNNFKASAFPHIDLIEDAIGNAYIKVFDPVKRQMVIDRMNLAPSYDYLLRAIKNIGDLDQAAGGNVSMAEVGKMALDHARLAQMELGLMAKTPPAVEIGDDLKWPEGETLESTLIGANRNKTHHAFVVTDDKTGEVVDRYVGTVTSRPDADGDKSLGDILKPYIEAKLADGSARVTDGTDRLLERIEAFLADGPGTDAQDVSTALLRDLRAAMGKVKPYTVIGTDGYVTFTEHVTATDADDAWQGFTKNIDVYKNFKRVAVFPGHLVEE